MSPISVALILGFAGRQAPVAELPFELVGNHIYIKGTAAGKPISLMLDSGAGMSVMDSGLAEKWNLPRDANGVDVRGAGSGTTKAQMLKNFKVAFDGAAIEQPIMLGIPLAPLQYLEGRPIEAVIGFEFFKKYVIQIDYAHSLVRLYSPDTFKYEGRGASIPIRLVGNHPHFSAEVEIPGIGKKPVEVMVDTGAGSSVSISGKFVDQEKLNDKLPPSPSIPTGAGVGGATSGRNVRIDAMTIGGYRVVKPIASLDLGSGGVTGTASPFDILVGGDLMRRFTVTFDYSRSQMYLEPNDNFKKPFDGDQTGMYVKAEGDDLRSFVVMFVVDGSPAKEAGVQVGDHVVSIDRRPASGFELFQLKALLRDTGKTWDVVLNRDGKTLNVKLQGRPLTQ